MTAPVVRPADRLRTFLTRYEAAHPGATVMWSDRTDRAQCVRLDDLRALLALADPPSTPRETQ